VPQLVQIVKLKGQEILQRDLGERQKSGEEFFQRIAEPLNKVTDPSSRKGNGNKQET
jgi:hypothetical protein